MVEEISRVPVESLNEAVRYLQGRLEIWPTLYDSRERLRRQQDYQEDFQDVKGLEHVKRALEVIAAGGHNLLMIGPPGSGKTMLARRMGSLLPTLSFEEALECTKIHSIAGLLHSDAPMLTERPFRSPHHTISSAGLVGGGTVRRQ